MIVVEKQHKQKSKRHGYEDPFHLEIPEFNQPAPRLRGVECLCHRYSFNVRLPEVPRYVRKTNPKDGAKLQSHQRCGR